MKNRLWVLIVPIVLVWCWRDPETPADHFDKKAQCFDIGKSYIEDQNATQGFYGYVEELDTCVGATIKQYDTITRYDIYDILDREVLFDCEIRDAHCVSDFFEQLDRYSLR